MRASIFAAPKAHYTSLACVALLWFPRAASAQPSKDECIDANTAAQAALRAHKLSEARTLLQSCLDPVCPGLVRADCSRRLDVVERVQPTIIFDAKDDAGNDVSAVAVSIDGHPLTDRLDGSELTVDPGPHEFVFQASGAPPVRQTYVLKEFEKARRELVVLPARPAPPALTTTPAARTAAAAARPDQLANAEKTSAAATAPHAVTERPVPSPVYLLGGIALAGWVDFAIAGSLGNHSKSDLERCSPFCDQKKVNVMRREYLVGDVGLAAGVAGLVGAAIFFFARPSQQVGEAVPTHGSSEWLAAARPDGGFIGWRASF